MKSPSDPPFAGVLSVLCTPFHQDGHVDVVSLRRQVEFTIQSGASAVVVFGLAGETYKLSDAEREDILRLVVEVASGMPVIAGSEHSGVEAAIERSIRAAQIGASGLMLYPPTFVAPSPSEIVDYYEEVGAAAALPVIVQDAPSWTRVALPVPLLAEIVGRVPRPTMVKVEAPPTAPKLRAVAAAGGLGIGGYGMLYLPEEFDSGIVATMPGAGVPRLYVDIWRALQADPEYGMALHARVLPLLTFQMSSLDVFVATQKYLLHRQGVLSSVRMRRPGTVLDHHQIRWLDRLIDACGIAEWTVG